MCLIFVCFIFSKERKGRGEGVVVGFLFFFHAMKNYDYFSRNVGSPEKGFFYFMDEVIIYFAAFFGVLAFLGLAAVFGFAAFGLATFFGDFLARY